MSSSVAALASRWIDDSRLRAAIGIAVLSLQGRHRRCERDRRRRCRQLAHATCWTISGMTGLTLPGMIELPACRAGRMISPRPPFGPEPSRRRSPAILLSDRATTFERREPASTRASWLRLRLEVIGGFGER